MSHDIVNELITLMGQSVSVLRKLLCRIKNSNPCWFAIIVDETADVAQREQLNLTIRYVNDDYVINEDSIGLFSLPNMTAATIHVVMKDLLLSCNLPLPLCRGQAYDGASAMQGRGRDLLPSLRMKSQQHFQFTVLHIC